MKIGTFEQKNVRSFKNFVYKVVYLHLTQFARHYVPNTQLTEYETRYLNCDYNIFTLRSLEANFLIKLILNPDDIYTYDCHILTLGIF